MMMRELVFDWREAPSTDGLCWCKQISPPVMVGDVVMIGSEDVLRQATVQELRGELAGVRLDETDLRA